MSRHANSAHEPKGNRRLWRREGLPLWNLVILVAIALLVLGAGALVIVRFL